jgi:hypothetical protein
VDSVGSGNNRDFSKLLVRERIQQELRFLNCKFLKIVVEWILLEVATIVISERSLCKKELNESLGF